MTSLHLCVRFALFVLASGTALHIIAQDTASSVGEIGADLFNKHFPETAAAAPASSPDASLEAPSDHEEASANPTTDAKLEVLKATVSAPAAPVAAPLVAKEEEGAAAKSKDADAAESQSKAVATLQEEVALLRNRIASLEKAEHHSSSASPVAGVFHRLYTATNEWVVEPIKHWYFRLIAK